jgi:multicomponent Na+:H+ antiporter subunit D
MDWGFWLPQFMIFTSLIPALIIFLLRDEQFWLRTSLNLGGSGLKLILAGFMAWGVLAHDRTYEARLPFLHNQELILRVEPLSLMLVALSSILWFITTIYAIGYLENSPNRTRFFGFFSLCVTATIGIALAGNLITFLIFYEMLSVVTYPLVVHRGTLAALAAGRTYLLYTLGGGVLLLLGVVWLQVLAGPIEFQPGGTIQYLADEHRVELIAIFALLVAGLGVKAAIVPLHRWLPEAMIAPAPVSALLHAVAVVKAGAYGIVRVVYDVYGLELSNQLEVLFPLALFASFTIIYGSARALTEFDLKRRLAYSTVSQVSYIALGTALIGPAATVGATVHLIHQGIMKITLFFCAGVFAEARGIHDIREMSGVGRSMPLTMSAFTLGAFGMIGVPPLAGFVSKWYLGLGSLESNQPWVIAILVASSVMNAAYFLPIVYKGWFGEPHDDIEVVEAERFQIAEAPWSLLGPAMTTAAFSLLAGLLAAWVYSPLSLAEIVANQRILAP